MHLLRSIYGTASSIANCHLDPTREPNFTPCIPPGGRNHRVPYPGALEADLHSGGGLHPLSAMPYHLPAGGRQRPCAGRSQVSGSAATYQSTSTIAVTATSITHSHA